MSTMKACYDNFLSDVADQSMCICHATCQSRFQKAGWFEDTKQ